MILMYLLLARYKSLLARLLYHPTMEALIEGDKAEKADDAPRAA